MSSAYEELIDGEVVLRSPPGQRHELICQRLHAILKDCLAELRTVRLLEARSLVQLSDGNQFRPDLALVTVATGKVFLAVEIVDSHDHKWDTVRKKQIYEELRIPRLWMIDPRYDNVEVYHATEYGLVLQAILANKEYLTESLLPLLKLQVAELFRPPPAVN
jgi:Uma2 family endonuclease